MASKGKQKFSKLLSNIKKLSKTRQSYWLGKIASLRSKGQSRELGAEPSPAQAQTGKDWLLDTANWFDSIYQYAASNIKKTSDVADDAALATANELDKIYNDVGREVLRVPVSAGRIVGGTLGGVSKGFLDNAGLKDNAIAPYLIGAGVALAAYLYLAGPRKVFGL